MNPTMHPTPTPTSTPSSSTVRIPFVQLQALLEQVFQRHGTSAQVAAALAHNCALAQRDGADSHGVFRIPGYLSTLASGWVNGQAVPQVEDVAPGYVAVDAGNGFAQPALDAARGLLLDKVRRNGIALLAIRNSHHFAALWLDVEPFAREGLVALAFVNSMACVVPSGGHTALFGTNPIAFAAPRAGGEPLVFDLATSAIAHGDVQIAAREGRTLPEGYGVDRHGQPTCDPAAILDGGALLVAPVAGLACLAGAAHGLHQRLGALGKVVAGAFAGVDDDQQLARPGCLGAGVLRPVKVKREIAARQRRRQQLDHHRQG